MNERGQMGLGMILLMFIGVIVGAIFLVAIAQQIGTSTNLDSYGNVTIVPGANGNTNIITTYRAFSNVVITNATDGAAIPATNYSVANNQITNGALSVVITTVDNSTADSAGWNVTATAQPLGYIPDAGARSVTALIVIFFALAIAVVALEPTLRSGLLSMMGN